MLLRYFYYSIGTYNDTISLLITAVTLSTDMWKSTFILLVFIVCLSSSTFITNHYAQIVPAFLVTQFGPAYKRIEDKIDIDLIPFGKATVANNSGTWNFTCQHGDGECYGNKIHACAIALYPVVTSTQFVLCAMASGNSSLDENLQNCAASTNITWTSIQECLSSGKANELLASNGDRTSAVEPKIAFIPTIVYNNVFSEPLENITLSYFLEVVEFLSEEIECKQCHFSGSNKVSSSEVFVSGLLFAIILQKLLF
ncbi:hypothetical protein NQ314_004415 [Rhamnusium bicolor]|uniref:Uncharacterized protein n=1 Tax=Rhamnusium bicolor TaxID=1586634 RepID=A0AAV8ZJ06_9CUCU|nr:hypothetical protein NQ314_004415 [Rhamnusium bicolor]